MALKQCSKCEQEKSVKLFSRRGAGYKSRCKPCTAIDRLKKINSMSESELQVKKLKAREIQKTHYKNNTEKCIVSVRKYSKTEKGIKAKKKSSTNPAYSTYKKKYHREWCRKKYHTKIQYRLALGLRNRLNQAIKGCFRSGSAVSD